MNEIISALDANLAYDSTSPLRSEIEETEEELDVSVSRIRFDGIRRQRVTAILVEPFGNGPFPALAFLHPFSADTSFFLAEAKSLAAEGFVSLLIEAPHKRPHPHNLTADIGDPKSLRNNYLQTIGDIRRGYDLLEQLSTVDTKHFGFVGQGEGAALGPALSALDARAMVGIFVAGMPRQSVYWGCSTDPAAVERRSELGQFECRRYTRTLAAFDALALAPHTQAVSWLLQFPTDDIRFPEEEIELLTSELPAPADVLFYGADRMSSNAPETDRRKWLQSRLRPR